MPKGFGKKESSSQEASLSSIPVPPSDSALVIDLPEGQKLVLGKINEGTVIEVATWRGTGRPDSRTNRLMLGVSFGSASGEKNQEEVDPSSNLVGIQLYLYRLKALLNLVLQNAKLRGRASIQLLNRTLLPLRNRFLSRKKLGESELKTSAETRSLEEEDFDVDKWLDSIRSAPRVSKLEELRNAELTSRPNKSRRKSNSPQKGPKSKRGRKSPRKSPKKR